LNGKVIETVRPNQAFDLWWGGNWEHPSVFRTTTRPLEMKSHVIEIYSSESCCDGRQHFQFKRGSGEWTDLTQDNLQNVARDCDPEPDCTEVPYEDCVSKILSTTVAGTLESFAPAEFRAKIAAELKLASSDDVQIISVAKADSTSGSKFGKVDTSVIVMFRLVGCQNSTLNYAGARVEEIVNVVKEIGTDGLATDSVLSKDVSTTPKLTPIQFNAAPSIVIQRIAGASRAITPVDKKSSSGSVAALIVVSCITFVLFVILLALLVMCRQSASAFAKLNHKDVESGSDNGV
jgi:hypothetical protein